MAVSKFTSSSTDWNVSSDIYDIVENIDNLKKRYIDIVFAYLPIYSWLHG